MYLRDQNLAGEFTLLSVEDVSLAPLLPTASHLGVRNFVYALITLGRLTILSECPGPIVTPRKLVILPH